MINERHNMYLGALYLPRQHHVITAFFSSAWLVLCLLVSPSCSACICPDVSAGVLICSPVCVFTCVSICRVRIAPFRLSNLPHRAAVIAIYTWLGPQRRSAVMVPPLSAALGGVIVSHHPRGEPSTLAINKRSSSHGLYLSQAVTC